MAGDRLMQVPAVIQITSTVSDGKYSIPEIIKTAKENDIKIIVLTDRDFMKWRYGIWPLRNVIKKTVESNSVSKYGMKKYFKEIEELQNKNTDIVLFHGVESAPFYYWDGSPFKKNLKISNWHKHMFIVGLPDVKDYENIPSVSNDYSLTLPFSFKDIYRYWPVLLLLIGILSLRKREYSYKDLKGNQLGKYSLKWRIFGICNILIGLLFIVNNFPFRSFKYDQYHGDQRIVPYQNLINYVNQKGGLIFWTHPEMENVSKEGDVKIETKKYTQDLLESMDYTGFTIFYEGYEKAGRPGGIWDEVLKEYCRGIRSKPSWAIGGLGFDQTGDIGEAFRDLKTIILIPGLTKQEVLRALENGKMYVVYGSRGNELLLENFTIKDSLSDVEGIVADEINLKGKPIIKIKGYFLNKTENFSGKIEIKLVRNGTIIETFNVDSPFEVNYHDSYFNDGKKDYYRLEIRYPNKTIITNPIFVNFKI